MIRRSHRDMLDYSIVPTDAAARAGQWLFRLDPRVAVALFVLGAPPIPQQMFSEQTEYTQMIAFYATVAS